MSKAAALFFVRSGLIFAMYEMRVRRMTENSTEGNRGNGDKALSGLPINR
jgi:hypothetical protein